MLDELKQAKVMTMAAIVQDAKFLDEVFVGMNGPPFTHTNRLHPTTHH